MPPLQPVRGTSDHLPHAKAGFDHVTSAAREISSRYGYAEMATPIFEFTEVYSRPLGASSDVVTKETYSFEDRGGAGLTLRPEGTAAAMRAVISNGLTQSLPLRWFYAGPMFRYERPQKGRLRQFHQFGCELIGPAGAEADAEIISAGADILDQLGVLSDTTLHLNSLGDTASRQAFRTALTSFLDGYKDSLSEDSQRRLDTNPLRILDSKNEGDRQIISEAPRLPEYLTDEAKAHFDDVQSALTAAGIDYEYDPLLVRGLDYYSHTAFEFVTDRLGAQGTVLGGGRYDGLSEMLGGPHLPAVGFAAGIERLALLCDERVLNIPSAAFIAADADAKSRCFALARDARRAGVSAVMIYSGQMGKKMKAADKMGCRAVVIAGSDELATGRVVVRDMQKGGQVDVATSDLVTCLVQMTADTERSAQSYDSNEKKV